MGVPRGGGADTHEHRSKQANLVNLKGLLSPPRVVTSRRPVVTRLELSSVYKFPKAPSKIINAPRPFIYHRVEMDGRGA